MQEREREREREKEKEKERIGLSFCLIKKQLGEYI